MLYTTLRIIFAVIFQLLFRAKTYGKENLPAEGPVILAANHMSNWDPPLLATFLPRPVSYMAKIELFEHPIFGAAILTLLPQVLTAFAEYEQLLLGLIMMLVMIFMRDGMLPTIMRLIRGKDE